MTSKPNYIFYSNKCKTSMTLITLLKSEKMLPYFTFKCVDNMDRIPDIITRVPTLVISSTHQILVADEIFHWLDGIRNSRCQRKNDLRSSGNENANEQEQHKNNKQPEKQQSKNPSGFVNGEMDGLSDTYAYTKLEITPQHSYLKYDDLGQDSIYTAPEEKTKINESKSSKITRELERKRYEQDNDIHNLFVKQQKNKKILEKRNKESDNLIVSIVSKQNEDLKNLYDI